MRELCREHGVLFIADEVITGFGRTGPLFACTDEEIVPDFMTTAKGLTSGYVPMGAVFMADHVYNVIADGAGAAAVGHGYTYSAHPVSAAVALEVLKLYEDGLLDNGIKAGARLMAGLEGLRDHPLVGDVRGRGMLAAIELVVDKEKKTPLPASAMPARRIFDRAWDNGLIIRAFANGVLGYAPRSAAPTPISMRSSNARAGRSTRRWTMPMSARHWHEGGEICRVSKYRRGGRFRNFVPRPHAFSANPARGKCQTAVKTRPESPDFRAFERADAPDSTEFCSVQHMQFGRAQRRASLGQGL